LAASLIGATVVTLGLASEHVRSPHRVIVTAGQTPSISAGPFSAATFTERVRNFSAEIEPKDLVTAKLMTWRDLRDASSGHAQSPLLADTSMIWAVEVVGVYHPFPGADYKWAILFFDANTGEQMGTIAHRDSAAPAFWSSLPDISAQ